MVKSIEDRWDEEAQQQKVIEEAVGKADKIISSAAGSDKELLTLYTTTLACRFAEKARIMAMTEVARKQLLESHP